jgi:hypothetical protein
VLLDGVFLVGFLVLHVKTFIPAGERILELTVMMQEFASRAASSAQLNQLLLESLEFRTLYNEVLGLVGILLLGLYALWVVFRGGAAWLSLRMAGRQYSYWRFLGKYSWLSLLWGLGLLALLVLSVRLAAAAFAPLPLLGDRVAATVVFLLLAVLGYFASVSYALIPFPRTLRTSWQAATWHAKQLLPRYLGSLALILVLALNVVFFFRLHPLAGGASILLLLLPGMTFARLFIMTRALQMAKKA